MKKILSVILTFTLIGCQSQTGTKDAQKNLYISFTVTHAIDGDEDIFESDIYYYNLEEKEVELIATIPYTSQYPLAVYDINDNMIYYSSKDLDVGRDELYQYNVITTETKKLTSSLYSINYIISKENTIVLGAIDKSDSKTLGPMIYNKITGQLEVLPWEEDDFIDNMSYNPLIDTTVFSCSSITEKYDVIDQANEKGIEAGGINNRVYTLKDEEYTLEFEVDNAYIENIAINKDSIYYDFVKSFSSFDIVFNSYHLSKKKITQVESVIEGRNIVYVSDDGGYFYCVNGGTLSLIDIKTNEKQIIHSVNMGKEFINNAHILEKR